MAQVGDHDDWAARMEMIQRRSRDAEKSMLGNGRSANQYPTTLSSGSSLSNNNSSASEKLGPVGKILTILLFPVWFPIVLIVLIVQNLPVIAATCCALGLLFIVGSMIWGLAGPILFAIYDFIVR